MQPHRAGAGARGDGPVGRVRGTQTPLDEMELLVPMPPTPMRVREEWTDAPGHGWLQLGKCWFGTENADDGPREWEMVRRSSDETEGRASASSDATAQAVDILATLERQGQPDALILVLVYRPPVDAWVIEMPAGMVDPGETVDAAARRELLEETGFTARAEAKQEKMADSGGKHRDAGSETTNIPTLLAWPDPWKSRENYHTCHLTIDGDDPANDTQRVMQALEPGEHIVPLLVPLLYGGGTLIKQLKQASIHNDWLLEARLSGIAQGLALASQLRHRL